jgi:nucleoside-diphosphate-sugar epimerase
MRFLITGGTGFIGSRLALRLLNGGHGVRLLSLIKTPAEQANADELARHGVELIEASVADRARHADALAGIDVVHHIAATMREADVPDRVFWDTNVAATQDLARASRSAGVKRFVYCSSVGITGGIRGRTVDEGTTPAPKDIYGRTKAAAEAWVLTEARSHGLAATAVRPADVYGPGDNRLLKLFQMIQKGSFFYLGSGTGRRHMIYIDDLLDGMIAAQEHPEAIGCTFHLAGPAPIPLRTLVELIATELNVAPPRKHYPYRPVWMLSWLVEAGCRPFRIQPPIYPRRVDFYAHDYSYDTSRARSALGWTPKVDVVEGVRRTIAHYRAQGALA